MKHYLQLNLSLLYWILIAPFRGQFFKIAPIFRQMVFIGVRAAPMVALTAFSVGVTLAMQAEGRNVKTVESLAGENGKLNKLQQAFQNHHADRKSVV